jgi:hypothetical protein
MAGNTNNKPAEWKHIQHNGEYVLYALGYAVYGGVWPCKDSANPDWWTWEARTLLSSRTSFEDKAPRGKAPTMEAAMHIVETLLYYTDTIPNLPSSVTAQPEVPTADKPNHDAGKKEPNKRPSPWASIQLDE